MTKRTFGIFNESGKCISGGKTSSAKYAQKELARCYNHRKGTETLTVRFDDNGENYSMAKIDVATESVID